MIVYIASPNQMIVYIHHTKKQHDVRGSSFRPHPLTHKKKPAWWLLSMYFLDYAEIKMRGF